MTSSDLRDQLQRTLGSAYTLEHELGGGGMSRVFVAEDTSLRRKVVVKVLPPELVAGVNVERFNREILVAAKLQHPHIVPVLAAGEMDGLPYYTMPFVEGESLRVRLARTNALSITDAVGVLRDVAKALAYAHERGIVHRDIKPDNVLVTGGSATVTDFGIAKAISASRTAAPGSTLTQVGTSIGTPAYMSPEQAAGDPDTDHRADIYSFGCVAYELLAGRPPFVESSPRKLLAAQMGERPKPIAELRPDTPANLADLTMRCLEKDADQRPQRASDLVRVLETVTSTGGGTQPAMPAVLLGGRGMLRKALLLYAGAFVAVAILAKAAIVGIGLPDWVFPGALIVMALGLPVVLFTGYVQRVARRAVTATPTFTPGGTPFMAQGTMATLALKASPHVSWYRTAMGGVYAGGAFVALIGVWMLLRALGIGPAGSLMAAGVMGKNEKILVADFTSPATDTSLGGVVTEALRTDLAQSRAFSLVPASLQREALRRMQRDPGTHLDASLAREIATREGVKAIVEGEVLALGGGFVISAKLLATQSGDELAAFRETADSPKEIIAAIDKLSRRLREKIGESLRAIHATPALEQVTTGSLEALRKYIAGARAEDFDSDSPRAISLLDEAIRLDTGFAMAYRKLAVVLGNSGLQRARQLALIEHAYTHRDRLTDVERLLVEGYYWKKGPHADNAKAIAAYEQVLEIAPQTRAAVINLGVSYDRERQHAKALEYFRRGASIDSTASQSYLGMTESQMAMGRWALAERALAESQRRFPANRRVYEDHLSLLYGLGQVDSAAAVATRRYRESGANIAERSRYAITLLSALAYRAGKLKDGGSLDREATAATVALGDTAALLASALAAATRRSWFLNDREGALRTIDSALARQPIEALPPADRPYPALISALARAGRADRARLVLANFEKSRVAYTGEDDEYDHAFSRGSVAFAERRYDDAVRDFTAADVGWCEVCALPSLAEAYDAGGHADSAIVVYERFLTRPGIYRVTVDADALAPAHKRLGELYEAKNDPRKAAEHYEQFVSLWKNADPELQPRVAEVRARIAKLRSAERR